MAEWQRGVYGQRTVLTKDVSLVSVLSVLILVELETQRVKRKRKGARDRVWRERVSVGLYHARTPCSKPDILYQQGPLSVESTDCTKSTKHGQLDTTLHKSHFITLCLLKCL